MARTSALREHGWESKLGSIYSARPFDCEIFTVPPDRKFIECHHVPTTFGAAIEADQLSDLLSQAIRSIEGLADPYGSFSSQDDPFEYRSVPPKRGRVVRAKVRYGDRVRPMQIDDD
jgi:hypothetical protein